MNEILRYSVAGVEFRLFYSSDSIIFSIPETYEKFVKPESGQIISPDFYSIIRIDLVNNQKFYDFDACDQISSEPSWQLARDNSRNFIFHVPRSLPERWLIMEEDFSSGKLILSQTNLSQPYYPLSTLDILTFSNWLASRGDLLLHASGIIVEGKGYAFIGQSGAGKSTLISRLAQDSEVTVLGEDQLALRYLDNRFWIFGTPWHLDKTRCSPIGAPIETVFFLDYRGENVLQFMNSVEGFKRLMLTSFIPYYRNEIVGSIMDRLQMLGQTTPFHLLTYRIGDDILKQILNA